MADNLPLLSFLVGLNIDDLKEKAEEGKKQFEELGKSAEHEGRYIDALFQHLGKGYDVSTVDGKMNALRNAIEENSLTLRQWGNNVDVWSKQADKAFSKGDFDLFNTINKDIAQTTGDIKDLEAETTYLTKLLKQMEGSMGRMSQSGASAPRLFTTEEDYQHVKDLEQAIDGLKNKLAEAGNDTEFTTINGQIIALQKQLDEANARAVAAASALGDTLGTKASETSTRLYELNATIESQQQTYDDLVAKLEKVAEEMDAATAAGDTSKLKDLQLEYQHLAKEVENANNALSETKGEQKDASDSWEGTLDTIASLGETIDSNTQPVNGAITSFSQLAGVFRESDNPIQAFRAGLQAMRGGLNLSKVSVKGLASAFKAMTKTLLSNPFTALLLALTAVTMGIIKLVQSMESQAEKQKRLNALQATYLEQLQQTAQHHTQATDEAIKDKERELSVIKSSNASLSKQWKVEDELNKLKREKAAYNVGYYADEIKNINKNREALYSLQQELNKVNDAKANGDKKVTVTVNGNTSKQKVDEAIENLQAAIKNKELQIKLGVDSRDALAEQRAEEDRVANERKEKSKQVAATERSVLRETQSVRISLERDSYKRDIEQTKANAENKIKDLKLRLAQEANLTAATRKSINDQIMLQQQKLHNDLEKLERQHQQKLLAIRRQVEDVSDGREAKTAEEQRATLQREYSRLVQDVDAEIIDNETSSDEVVELFKLRKAYEKQHQAELAILNLQIQQQEIETAKETISLRLAAVREGTMEELKLRLQLIEQERLAEIQANKLLPGDQRQDEADINAEYRKKREDEERAFYACVIGDYVNYQQEMLNLTSAYESRRAELEQQIAYESDPKKKQALRKSISELERTYIASLNSLQNEFIKNNIGDVFNEQTVENIKEAKRLLDQMENETDEQIITRLGLDGNDPGTKAAIAAFREQIRKVRNELREMGKGYSLKDAFSDAFTGKTKEEVQRGVDYIVSGFSKVSSVASGIASAMREFAEATGNAKLEKMADIFDSIANTISTAGGYAAAGASIGGGWGAIIGAVIGIGQGVVTGILKSDAQRAAEEKQRTEEAHDYLQEVVDGIGSVIGSIDSLSDVISSLNYLGYQKELIAAISSLRSDANYNTDDNWRGLYYGVDFNRAVNSLDDQHLLQVLGGTIVGNPDGGVQTLSSLILSAWPGLLDKLIKGTIDEAGREYLRSIIKEYQSQSNSNVREQYANQENHKDYILDQRRLHLIEEMNALLRDGNMSSIEYFNILMKADKLSIDMLKQKREELYRTGQSTIEIENQIAESEYEMQERVRKMFEGLAGTDLQSIVNKWLDIFKEFGDNFDVAVEKINESIDDMIRNMVIQTAFVQPLLARLKAYMNNYAKENKLVQDDEGNYTWTNVAFLDMAEGLRDFISGAKDDFISLNNTLNTLGIGFGDSSNDRSAQAKGIATASQDSVDELNGRATTIQLHTFNISENSNTIRDNTNAILGSVRQIEYYTQHLVRMDYDIHVLKNTIYDIQSHGVKIRTNS